MPLDEIESRLLALIAKSRRSRNAIVFDEGRLCLTRKGMLVSTSIVNGRRWYFHSMSSLDERRHGIDQLRYLHQVELAERLAARCFPAPAPAV